MFRGPSSVRAGLSVVGKVFLTAVGMTSVGICLLSLFQSVSHL